MKFIKFLRTMFVLSILIATCVTSFAQTSIVTGKVVVNENDSEKILPGARVTATLQIDSKQQTVNAMLSNVKGDFSLSLPKVDQKYIINIQSLGYKTLTLPISLSGDSLNLGKLVMVEDTVLLNEVRVVGDMKTQDMDRRTYVFSQEQRANAVSGQQLISQLPGFRLDPMTNSIATLKHEPIMYLMNGVPTTEAALRSLSQKAIKRVIVYDVAPAEYHTDGYLINVIIEKPEQSFSGDIYLSVGSLFESFAPALSWVNGKSMWTFNMPLHYNPKGLIDYKSGTEIFTFPDGVQKYKTNDNQQMTSISLTPSLSYLYSGKKVKMMLTGTYGLLAMSEMTHQEFTSTANPLSLIYKMKNKLSDKEFGGDAYVEYALKEKKHLIFNSNIGYTTTAQILNSQIVGSNPVENQLDVDRLSVTNELRYRDTSHPVNYTLGARSRFTKTSYGTPEVPDYSNQIITSAYGEISGRPGKFQYRTSVYLNHENHKSPLETYSFFNVTPKWMLGYKITDYALLRYQGSLANIRPVAQQLANKSLKVSPFMFKSGNPYLRNQRLLSNEILLRLTKPIWSLDWSLSATNHFAPIFTQYSVVQKGGRDFIQAQPMNGKQLDRYGSKLTLTLDLFNNSLRLGLNGSVEYNILKRLVNEDPYRRWVYSASASLGYNYKNWTFSYYQIIDGKEFRINEVMDWEPISYFSAGYRWNNLSISGSVYFPFSQDKVRVESISRSPYSTDYEWHFKSKERTFGISLSWFFGSVDKRLDSNRVLENSDPNSGAMSIM